jgi:hypothetical protein
MAKMLAGSRAYSSQFTMMNRTRDPTIAASRIQKQRSITRSRSSPARAAARPASCIATRKAMAMSSP